MDLSKIFSEAGGVTPANFEQVMQSAIALELATIPTYLSTYYSIKRAQDQDTLAAQIKGDLDLNGLPAGTDIDELVQELTVDVLVHANKTAALTMSVVIEEMLHLSLSSNVKQAIVGPPDILAIAQDLKFPAYLAGHEPEFWINAGPLSPDQLGIFLQIESPKAYVDPDDPTIKGDDGLVKYNTIGGLYDMIKKCINENYADSSKYRPLKDAPQLVPDYDGNPTPYYSQNSINTVYYDRGHNPHFSSADNSGGLMAVTSAKTACEAIDEIKEQGEGNDDQFADEKTLLVIGENGLPEPMEVKDGKISFLPGDYDDSTKQELSHFAKFMEAYSMGDYYQKKFAQVNGLKDFYDYFVYNQAKNPKQADYKAYLDGLEDNDLKRPQAQALYDSAVLGNAIYTYILLMVETCYYTKDSKTQFSLFMYGIHKAMIWLLSGVGNKINIYNYEKNGETYNGAVTFEHYNFATDSSPRSQIIDLVSNLAQTDPKSWGWTTQGKYSSYWQALPDVYLDHSVMPNIPSVPQH